MARILFASHAPDLTTSYARVVREFAAAAADAGHDVAFVTACGAAAPFARTRRPPTASSAPRPTTRSASPRPSRGH
jgi:hypothetical protein